MKIKGIMKALLNPTSIEELAIFGIAIFIGCKFQVISGIILVILYFWIKLKYYEGKILENYAKVDEIEKNITSNPNSSKDLAARKIDYETKPYRLEIQRQYEPQRKFLVDKLVIITFIGLLLISKF